MVSKDQAVGFALIVVCVVAAVGYTVSLFYPQWLVTVGLLDSASVQFWLIAVPVLVALGVVVYMGVWVGSMKATCLPPRLIERLMTVFKRRK